MVGLFFAPTKVAHAIKGIETAANATARVGFHNSRKAAKARNLAVEFEEMAECEHDRANDHIAEADRASRVALKLRDLVA